MRPEGCAGLYAMAAQHEEPVWEPLERAVGTRLSEAFMWMHENRLSDGTRLHAYKHCHTRRYLYLSKDGRAFERGTCLRFVPLRLDFAIEQAICNWWILSGWEEEDAEALRVAILNAQRSVAES